MEINIFVHVVSKARSHKTEPINIKIMKVWLQMMLRSPGSPYVFGAVRSAAATQRTHCSGHVWHLVREGSESLVWRWSLWCSAGGDISIGIEGNNWSWSGGIGRVGDEKGKLSIGGWNKLEASLEHFRRHSFGWAHLAGHGHWSIGHRCWGHLHMHRLAGRWLLVIHSHHLS